MSKSRQKSKYPYGNSFTGHPVDIQVRGHHVDPPAAGDHGRAVLRHEAGLRPHDVRAGGGQPGVPATGEAARAGGLVWSNVKCCLYCRLDTKGDNEISL